jgi:hypothetical protein
MASAESAFSNVGSNLVGNGACNALQNWHSGAVVAVAVHPGETGFKEFL